MQAPSTRVEEVFSGALSKAAGAQRSAFVAEACGGDAELRQRVEGLLAAHENAGMFLNTLEPAPPDETTLVSASERPGTVIGRYKLLQELGAGGFGRVFMAEQTEPVVRKVALKVIKLGMDTRQVIARFEAERQALAMMDHPNIAKVLDAGATPEGRPFFVMELVRGEPITGYCDKNNLSVPERLELFASVCNAVQHAHQKGIIHRDIKPSNVLVTVADGKPVPKVIDFGIAKATSARLTEKTLFTEQRHFVGTPEYMSPEQADGSMDIDTRADVYSLGVVLYELLIGVTPFESRRLRSAAYGEIQRIIREEEPVKPSTRLGALAALPVVATHRRTEPARLSKTIRGDLDWIVMRCLEKDRTRRYETVNGLAMDLQRHLVGEAVIAAPPSRAYRLRKFIKRNRGPVAAAGLVTAALVLGLAGTLWQARVAAEQRDTALREAKRADEQAKAEKQRADELKQVSDFQAAMLAQVDPTAAGERLTQDVMKRFEAAQARTDAPGFYQNQQIESFRTQWTQVNATDTARALIDSTILRPAVEAIDKQFKEQPAVGAQLRQALADVYRTLGLYDAAMPLQLGALDTRREVLGEEDPNTLESINSMGGLLRFQGKSAEAEPFLREALEGRRRVLGEEHAKTIQSINNLGGLLQAQGKLAEAEPYWREALEKNRRTLGPEHPETLVSLNNMGFLLQARGRFTEAEPFYREALEKRRRILGEEHPSTLVSINNMGLLLRADGKLAEAEPYFREALEKRRRVLGEDHPGTLTSLNNMGLLLRDQGKLAEAEPYWRETLARRRRVLGENHPSTLISVNNLGTLLQDQRKFDEAEPYLREGLEKSTRLLGEDHPDTIISISNMGRLHWDQRQLTEAEPYYRRALEKRRRVLGEEHPSTLSSIGTLGSVLREQGRLSEAEPLYQEALETCRRVLGEEHPGTLIAITNLGHLLVEQGKSVEAIELMDAAEPAMRKAFATGSSWRLAEFLTIGARARVAQGYDPGRFDLAEQSLLEAHRILMAAPTQSRAEVRRCTQGLVDLYTAWDTAEPGAGYDAKATQWRQKLVAPPVASQPAGRRRRHHRVVRGALPRIARTGAAFRVTRLRGARPAGATSESEPPGGRFRAEASSPRAISPSMRVTCCKREA